MAADRPDAEAVFIGCSGQRLARHLERLERRLGKKVLSANQVTGWHLLRLLGRRERIPQLGCLADVCPVGDAGHRESMAAAARACR